MTGAFADQPPRNARVNAMGKFYQPWFYEHVRTILNNKQVEQFFFYLLIECK